MDRFLASGEGRMRDRKEYNKEYYKSNKDRLKKYSMIYYRDNKEKAKEYKAKHMGELRREVLEHFGGKCRICGFDDPRALHIDHINGGATVERRRIRYNRIKYYKDIISGQRSDLQLLCANCNCIKNLERREYKRAQPL